LNRLHYVDFLRGTAVVWMVILQSLHSFELIDMFGSDYPWVLQWVNWFPLFMIIVGFSLALSFKRSHGFLKRNVKRGSLLIAVGGLLCVFKGWRIFDEALSGIGLAILLLLPVMALINKKHWLLWFLSGIICFLTSQLTFQLGAFNPFWLLSFMTVGVGFCRLLEP
jgi:uncharacterized membrane protein